ncbi:hypothetical protein GE061_009098 [Apolygus lucorum]|uniref:MADF domain-containing protein n=1 Tax=Apolygus lucorum TaxID=248454 RepID=A0A8S9Y1D0_APOLU|nr:hypothetical protein GE061_009098 [Apolygus lucorum]
MHRTFTTDIGQYSGGNMYAEQACIDIKEDIRRQTFVYYINPALVAASGSLALAGPFLTKWFSGMENPYSPNGLSLKLPTALYYPFPTDSGVVFYAIVLTQVIFGSILGYLILAPQLVFINLSQKLKRELRLVGYSLETLVTRAMRMTFENNVWKRKVTELDVDDTEFQRNVELSIKETIIHHQKASKLLSTAKVSVKAPLAAGYLFGLVTIAISLFNITLVDVETARTRWKTLRDRFNKERKKKPTGSGANLSGKWPLMPLMEFLLPMMTPRPTISNFQGPSLLELTGMTEEVYPDEVIINDDSPEYSDETSTQVTPSSVLAQIRQEDSTPGSSSPQSVISTSEKCQRNKRRRTNSESVSETSDPLETAILEQLEKTATSREMTANEHFMIAFGRFANALSPSAQMVFRQCVMKGYETAVNFDASNQSGC